MELVLGIALFCFSVVHSALVYIAVRNPKNPTWVSVGWVANVHAITITTMLFFAVAALIDYGIKVGVQPLGQAAIEYGVSAGLIVVTVLFVKALRIEEKVASFRRSAAQSI